jgi:hypothetical protein
MFRREKRALSQGFLCLEGEELVLSHTLNVQKEKADFVSFMTFDVQEKKSGFFSYRFQCS